MAKSPIDAALAALNAPGDEGFETQREILDRLGVDLLLRPATDGQIVARIFAITEPSLRDQGLREILGAGLDAARIARESGKARGQALIDAVAVALQLTRGQGRMTSTHSMLLAQLWTRNGLPAPAALAVQPEEIIPVCRQSMS